MIEKHELLSLGYYGRGIFTGSYKKLRYRIEKYIEPDKEDAKPQLLLTYWFGALSYDNTPDEDKTTFFTFFSDEGLQEITDFLNSLLTE